MKKAKYSGGDWKVIDTYIVNHEGTIASVLLNEKANAKLICAAPRLLETLQTILYRLDIGNSFADDELAKILRREIKAAI
jgi:hypothetical protein